MRLGQLPPHPTPSQPPARDHIKATARLARDRARVCIESPSWTVELLSMFIVTLGIALIVVLGQLAMAKAERDEARGDRDQLRRQAALEEKRPSVSVDEDGMGFRCKYFNVRREWEVAVAAECQVMGALLHMARASR
jgi:hypothetical protein